MPLVNQEARGREKPSKTGSSMVFGMIGLLGKQQMIEQAIGFMGGMEGREDPTLGMAATNALIGCRDRWAVVSQTTPDLGERIAERGIAAFGNLAQSLGIATLGQNGVKARERPDVIRRGKTSGISDSGQIAGRMVGAHARYGNQHRSGRPGNEGLSFHFELSLESETLLKNMPFRLQPLRQNPGNGLGG